MKVKELINQLSQLDQEKDIWVLYDRYTAFAPEVEVYGTDFRIDMMSDDIKSKVQEGDYVIDAY